MLEIIMCVNDQGIRNQIETEIEKIIKVNLFDLKIGLNTTSIAQLLDHAALNSSVFCVIMDFYLGNDERSTKYAKKIREMNPDVHIIFISDQYRNIQYLFHDYIKPTGFYKLPDDMNVFMSSFVSGYAEYTHAMEIPNYIILRIGQSDIRMDQKKILYIEYDERKVYIHTKYQRILQKESLDSLGNILDKDQFMRCHKAYIVNINSISKIDYAEKKISLSNNCNIPFSRKCKDELRAFFAQNTGHSDTKTCILPKPID